VGMEFDVEVWVETPTEWTNTEEGIVEYTLSVQYDPRVLTSGPALATPAWSARKFPITSPGWLSTWYLATYEVDTGELPETVDASGIIYAFAETIPLGVEPTTGVGGSGKLMRFRFKSLSEVEPSPIDLVKHGFVGTIEISALFRKANGLLVEADVVDDGYYISQTPDTRFLDLSALSPPFVPESPVGSIWHELWSTYSDEHSLDTWNDINATGKLDQGDEIQMTNMRTGLKDWYKVQWVRPTPVAGDGIKDMVAKVIVVIPEFPLGISLLLAIAPVIPIVYLWRTRKKVMNK